MNKKMITYVLGILLITEGALLLLPTLIALYYKENVVPFLITIAATVASGFVMTRFKPHDKTIVSMDGFAIVSLGWVLISLFGGRFQAILMQCLRSFQASPQRDQAY